MVLVAGMLPLSTAMQISGAADQLAERLVDVVGDSGRYPLLIGVFLLTAILGQLISNMATALDRDPRGVVGGRRTRRRRRTGPHVPERRRCGCRC